MSWFKAAKELVFPTIKTVTTTISPTVSRLKSNKKFEHFFLPDGDSWNPIYGTPITEWSVLKPLLKKTGRHKEFHVIVGPPHEIAARIAGFYWQNGVPTYNEESYDELFLKAVRLSRNSNAQYGYGEFTFLGMDAQPSTISNYTGVERGEIGQPGKEIAVAIIPVNNMKNKLYDTGSQGDMIVPRVGVLPCEGVALVGEETDLGLGLQEGYYDTKKE